MIFCCPRIYPRNSRWLKFCYKAVLHRYMYSLLNVSLDSNAMLMFFHLTVVLMDLLMRCSSLNYKKDNLYYHSHTVQLSHSGH